MLELQAIREQSGKPALERIEAGERVFANGDEDVDGELGPGHELRQRVAECGVVAVVDEVLLDLVEQQVDLRVLGGCNLDRLGERAGLDRRGSCHRLGECGCRGIRPDVADCDERFVRKCPQVARDAGAQHRALADPRRAVEDGQARRHDVRDDDIAVLLASEEELLVELRVFEGREPLVRARGGRAQPCECRHAGAHAAASRRALGEPAAQLLEQESAAASSTSTPSWRHCSAVNRLGSSAIAHDR